MARPWSEEKTMIVVVVDPLVLKRLENAAD